MIRRTAVVLAGWLTLTLGAAQSEVRTPDARPPDARPSDARPSDARPAAPTVRPEAATDRLADDAGAWLQRMVDAERRYAFSTAPEERTTWPAAASAATGGFAWPAGATLGSVRANFDVRWVGRERASGRSVVVIDLVARHDGPGWRFWIDADTGARVAYRATLGDGRVVAEGRGDARTLVPAHDAEPLRAPAGPTDGRAAAWRTAFGGLAGFDPVAVERVDLGSGVPALSVTLWDGLSGVVLFVYPAARTTARLELIVARSVGDLTLALAGPVPERVARAYLDELAGRRWARGDLRSLLRQWASEGGAGEGDPPDGAWP